MRVNPEIVFDAPGANGLSIRIQFSSQMVGLATGDEKTNFGPTIERSVSQGSEKSKGRTAVFWSHTIIDGEGPFDLVVFSRCRTTILWTAQMLVFLSFCFPMESSFSDVVSAYFESEIVYMFMYRQEANASHRKHFASAMRETGRLILVWEFRSIHDRY